MLHHEENLIKGLNAKNIASYNILYDEYYRTLVMFAMNITSNQSASEDIVQDVILTLWESDIQFSSFLQFRSYIYNSVRNASLNHLKHLGVEEKYMQYVTDTFSPIDDSDVINEEVYKHLYQTIDELPEKCREIFLMSMEGKKNSEIATTLDISVETVKTQKKRAVKYIKEHLSDSVLLINILYLSQIFD